MVKTLHELCQLLENCANRLEDEIKNSIESCRNKIIKNQLTESKLALEKAKDYHNKEIIKLLSGIITNIKQIVFHEDKIIQLSERNKLSEKELNDYSYVRRQVSAFSGGEKVVRRELRRAASETSVYCLDTWETFLNSEEMREKTLYSSSSLPNINVVPKRLSPNSKRKQKKLISSTFENILEDDEVGIKPMEALTEEPGNGLTGINSNLSKSAPDVNSDFSFRSLEIKVEKISNQKYTEEEEETESLNIFDEVSISQKTEQTSEHMIKIDNDNSKEDTKPKIVGFVVKKTATTELLELPGQGSNVT